MRSHGGEGKPLRGARLRGDGRLRGDRLRAQAQVLHSLLSGPKRFNELRVATDMCQSSLAKTLKELEEAGIAERKVHLDRPVAVEYRLSPKGAALFEAIRDLERWATRWVMNSVPREVTQ